MSLTLPHSETSIVFPFQDLYRALLEAESEAILYDVNMTEVEKLIFELKPGDQDIKVKIESQIFLNNQLVLKARLKITVIA